MKRRLLQAAALLLLAAAAASCSESNNPPNPSISSSSTTRVTVPNALPALDPAEVDTSSPDAVATAVADTVYTMLPGVDSSPNDAMVRAEALLDQRLRDAVRGFRPATGNGADWNDWARRRAFVSAESTISPQQRPPDGDTALRYVSVSQLVRTADRVLSRKDLAVVVTLARTPDGWRVSRLTHL